ncbi:MAG TPA: DUF4062 domain-containing protein [Mucilaginibacter sp.]|jgi:hypothetical protein|nr:DUF4062 domain-containing protein [Mucilaginibacter sp.]
MNQLKVFVSSTCYDLSQIRADLFEFLSNFGYQPILSEYSTFPINPNNDTLDNCIQNVNTADIFILIIGNRYGYTAESGKSITNTEYLYAKQKGIPIYIFVLKSIITLLPVWKKNKDADFSDTVESNKVFEFVEELRSSNKNWCFEFEKAQEIISTIKIQLAHLFKDSLDIRHKFSSSRQPEYWEKLSAKAISIVLKNDPMFEPLFFAQVLKDELMKFEDLKLDLDYHILFGCNNNIQDPMKLINWIRENLQSLQHFVNSGMSLMGKAFPVYFGVPGQPSDLKGLFYVASAMARLYKEMILWSIDIKSTYVHEDFQLLRDAFAKLIMNSANNIWDYPDQAQNDIYCALEQHKLGIISNIESVLTFETNEEDSDFVTAEMARLADKYSSND